MLLHADEGREDADDAARRGQHDEHPHVELYGRPVVPVDAGYGTAFVYGRGGGCGHG